MLNMPNMPSMTNSSIGTQRRLALWSQRHRSVTVVVEKFASDEELFGDCVVQLSGEERATAREGFVCRHCWTQVRFSTDPTKVDTVPTVVLMHGLLGSRRNMQPLAQIIVEVRIGGSRWRRRSALVGGSRSRCKKGDTVRESVG